MPTSAVKKQKDTTPKPLRPYLDLDFQVNKWSEEEAIGDCLLCGKHNKLFINSETGQFSCKSGICGKEGNAFTMMRLLWERWSSEQGEYPDQWDKLCEDRGLPESRLRSAGIVWVPGLRGKRGLWVLPVFGFNGQICQLETFDPSIPSGSKYTRIRGLKGVDHALYGAELLRSGKRKGWPVYIVEGHWDKLALDELLEQSGENGIVVAVPGNNVFKETWVEWFRDREVVSFGDNDVAGFQAQNRQYKMIRNVVKTFRIIDWPESYDDKFDVRDFYTRGGDWFGLRELIADYRDKLREDETPSEDLDEEAHRIMEEWKPLSSGERIPFEDVVKAYADALLMSDDLRVALRLIYAVIMSNQIAGKDPVWLHIAGPPGSGKTMLLTSCSEVECCVFRSTLTANVLVSGFPGEGPNDPSLIPKLIGKTFVLKDFTEVLALPSAAKDKIFGHLRGAYDGRVQEDFGNRVKRDYTGHFTMVTGVTGRIFGEQMSELGERFLIYHLKKGDYEARNEIILSAIQQVGANEDKLEKLKETAKAFLQFRIEQKDLPSLSREQAQKIAALAEIVGSLRTTVKRDERNRDFVVYRPEEELGTRLAKQFAKLLLALGLQRYPARIEEEDWEIIRRIGLNSCIGWNLELVELLIGMKGATREQLSEITGIPAETFRYHLNGLEIIGIVERTRKKAEGRGQPAIIYNVRKDIRKSWEIAGLPILRNKKRLRERAKQFQKIGEGKSKYMIDYTPVLNGKQSAPSVGRSVVEEGFGRKHRTGYTNSVKRLTIKKGKKGVLESNKNGRFSGSPNGDK